jgi:hypothetical protein
MHVSHALLSPHGLHLGQTKKPDTPTTCDKTDKKVILKVQNAILQIVDKILRIVRYFQLQSRLTFSFTLSHIHSIVSSISIAFFPSDNSERIPFYQFILPTFHFLASLFKISIRLNEFDYISFVF